jgi:hypothetical protein
MQASECIAVAIQHRAEKVTPQQWASIRADVHLDGQHRLIQTTLVRGGYVRAREGYLRLPANALMEEIVSLPVTSPANAAMRDMVQAVAHGESNEVIAKYARLMVELGVKRVAAGNADALEQGEAVPMEFVPRSAS